MRTEAYLRCVHSVEATSSGTFGRVSAAATRANPKVASTASGEAVEVAAGYLFENQM